MEDLLVLVVFQSPLGDIVCVSNSSHNLEEVLRGEHRMEGVGIWGKNGENTGWRAWESGERMGRT